MSCLMETRWPRLFVADREHGGAASVSQHWLHWPIDTAHFSRLYRWAFSSILLYRWVNFNASTSRPSADTCIDESSVVRNICIDEFHFNVNLYWWVAVSAVRPVNNPPHRHPTLQNIVMLKRRRESLHLEAKMNSIIMCMSSSIRRASHVFRPKMNSVSRECRSACRYIFM